MKAIRSKLTPLLQAEFLEALRQSAFREPAARVVGIAMKDIDEWLKKGQDNPRSIFGTFREQVLKVEANIETNLVAKLYESAIAGDATSARWLLERKSRERWGSKGTSDDGGGRDRTVRHIIHWDLDEEDDGK